MPINLHIAYLSYLILGYRMQRTNRLIRCCRNAYHPCCAYAHGSSCLEQLTSLYLSGERSVWECVLKHIHSVHQLIRNGLQPTSNGLQPIVEIAVTFRKITAILTQSIEHVAGQHGHQQQPQQSTIKSDNVRISIQPDRCY